MGPITVVRILEHFLCFFLSFATVHIKITSCQFKPRFLFEKACIVLVNSRNRTLWKKKIVPNSLSLSGSGLCADTMRHLVNKTFPVESSLTKWDLEEIYVLTTIHMHFSAAP